MRTRLLAPALAIVLGLAGGAAAQDTAPSAPPSQDTGPLVLEPVNNPFVVAPEYKFTEFDNSLGQLIGGYAGRLVNGQLLIGGAVYTLVSGSHETGLTYGGLLVGWSMPAEARLRFGGRALVGGGTATLPLTYQIVSFGGTRPSPYYDPRANRSMTYFGRDDIFIFEPEGNAAVRVAGHVTVDLSAGYRVTGYQDFARDRIDGATGTLAVQFGW
jgi:hypothetical protein